jgi:hypothetical protein
MGQTTFSGPVVSQNGFIDNSFTTAERDAIVDPQPGLLIYNTDTNDYEVYSGSSWDSAFTGGGGGGVWPYLIDGGQTISSFYPGGQPYYGPIVFNPAGTQYVGFGDSGAAGFALTYTNVDTPFSITNGSLSAGYMAGPGTYNLSGYSLKGAYYNGDGTKFYTVFENGSGNATVGVFDVPTPYNVASASFSTNFGFGYGGPMDSLKGFAMSEDGTKAVLLFAEGSTAKVTVMTLTTPFDLTTAQFGPNTIINGYLQNVIPGQSFYSLSGISLNSAGTAAFIVAGFYSMMSPSADDYVVELKLGTAFDFATIETSYNQDIATGNVSIQSYGTCSLFGSKFYLTGQYNMMGWGAVQYNVAVLQAPNITGVSPSTGFPGTQVTITGTGFTGVSSVTFGGTSASVVSSTATQIVVSSPSGIPVGTPVDVVVVNPAGSSTEVAAFTGQQSPGPTYPTTIGFSSSSINWNPQNDYQIAFNPTGTKMYQYANDNYIYEYTLDTPWDSQLGTFTGNVYSNIPYTAFPGMAWASDGLSATVIINAPASATPYRLTFATPFDVNSYLGYEAGATVMYVGLNGVTFSADGTKMFGFASGWLYGFDLATPFDGRSITSQSPTYQFNMSGTFGLYNYPQQVAFTSNGLIGYVFQSGISYTGEITQFQLSTAFDINTINTNTYQTISTSSAGIGYVGYGGIAVGSSNSKLFVAAKTGGFTNKLFEFNIS